MIMLSAKEFAQYSGISERHARRMAANGIVEHQISTNVNNQLVYEFPITSLSQKAQLQYYKSHGKEIPEELLPKRKPKTVRPHKELDEFTAAQREEIARWMKIIEAWDEYCAKSKLQKVGATEKFVELQRELYPDLRISKGILYRKKAALKADDLSGLIDNRGSWKKGTSSIPDVVWECFMYFYLDEKQPSIQFCMEKTELWLGQEAPQYLPLPDYSSFYRKVQRDIPKPLKIMGREGMKAFNDRCGTYIRRNYEGMLSNDWWVADNHTLDVITKGEDGKLHRLYLTAFFDARSGIFTGCYVTSAPSSQATLIALRKGILKYGVPKNIYVDNGNEFLAFDVGGRGHRQKKSTKNEFTPPPVFQRLGIKMTNAIVKNAQAKIIERRFNDVKERLSKLFPTYTGGNVLEKPESLKKILKSDNIPTDKEFTKSVEDILTYYFNEQPYSGAVDSDSGKTRMQVYREKLLEMRVASEADLSLMLMRSTRSQKVGKRGVHVKITGGEQLDYYTDDFKLQYLGQSVYCRYDPENMSTVRVYDLEDHYLATLPTDNTAVLEYGASKEDIARAMRKKKSFEKLTKEHLKAAAVTSLGKKTALELVLAAVEENKAKAEELKPKIISVHTSGETADIPLAVGQTNNIVEIDKARMIRNLEKRMEESE